MEEKKDFKQRIETQANWVRDTGQACNFTMVRHYRGQNMASFVDLSQVASGFVDKRLQLHIITFAGVEIIVDRFEDEKTATETLDFIFYCREIMLIKQAYDETNFKRMANDVLGGRGVEVSNN